MSYSLLIVAISLVGCLIGSLIVFLFIADKFINLGIKMAQKGEIKQVKIMPKVEKKVKESEEIIEARKRMAMIDGYTGCKEN